MAGLIKAVLLVIAVILTAVITPSINTSIPRGQAAYHVHTAGNSFSLEKRIILNNSHYIKTLQLFKTRDPRYYNTMI